MEKTLLYHLFKLGGLPRKLRPLLEAEGMVVCDEGIGGWYITNDLKAPGKRFKHRREGFSGFLAITRKRIIAYSYRKRLINIPVEDPRVVALHARLVDAQRIALSFESSLFQSDWKGVVELRFNTPKAPQFYEALIGIGVRQGTLAHP